MAGTTLGAAASAQDAAMRALRIKQNARGGDKEIVLPFGERISAKPYQNYRFQFKNNWWLGRPIDLILPEYRDEKYKLPGGGWCLGWPNSQEDGTTMQLSGDGFTPVLWKHIDKSAGARVRTHEGPNVRKGEGFVYWRRLLLVWVNPQLWEEEHIAPVIRSLSQLAHVSDDFEAQLAQKSHDVTGKDDILTGLIVKESVETQIAPPPLPKE